MYRGEGFFKDTKKTDESFQKWLSHGRIFAISAGIIGGIQALVWLVLSSIGIHYYVNCDENIEEKPMNLTFGNAIYFLYFLGCSKYNDEFDDEFIKKINIQPSDMHVWCAIILAFSALWLICSGLMVGGVWKQINKTASFFILGWCLVTICVSIIDMGLGILLGLDLGTINDLKVEDEKMQLSFLFLKFVVGFMMTMAFKGYVFWIFNVSSVIILITLSSRMIEPEKENDTNNHNSPMARTPISAYDGQPEIRHNMWMPEQTKMDNSQNQNTNMYNHSMSRFNSQHGSINSGYNGMEGSRYQQQQPLASIMKKSMADVQRQNDPYARQKPRNEPNLPSPDYSPPQVRPKPPYKSQYSDNSQMYYQPNVNRR